MVVSIGKIATDGGENDTSAGGCLCLLEHFAYQLGILVIKMADRLVKQVEVGRLAEHSHKCDTLLLAQGQKFARNIQLRFKAEMHKLRVDFLLRQMIGQTVLEQTVFERSQLGEKTVILKHHRQALLPQFIETQVEQTTCSALLRGDRNFSPIVGAQAIEEHAQRSLAAARRGLDKIGLSPLEGQINLPNVR